MKKFLGVLTVAAALFVAAFPSTPAADQPAVMSLDFVLYNSTTAAADAAIDTGKLTTANADTLTFTFVNSGSQARTAAVECWDPSRVVTTYRTTATVAATGGTAQVNMDLHASSATAPTGVTNLAMKPCHYASATAAAATGTMRTIVTKRSATR
jgi:hypothetical protein